MNQATEHGAPRDHHRFKTPSESSACPRVSTSGDSHNDQLKRWHAPRPALNLRAVGLQQRRPNPGLATPILCADCVRNQPNRPKQAGWRQTSL